MSLCPRCGDRPRYGAARAVRAGSVQTPDLAHGAGPQGASVPSSAPSTGTLVRLNRGGEGRSERLSFRLLSSSVWKSGFSAGVCVLYTRGFVCTYITHTHRGIHAHMCTRGIRTVHTHAHVYTQGYVYTFTRKHRSARTLAGDTHGSTCTLVGHTRTAGFTASSFLSAERNSQHHVSAERIRTCVPGTVAAHSRASGACASRPPVPQTGLGRVPRWRGPTEGLGAVRLALLLSRV